MITAINILFLLLLTHWAIKKPTKFVIGYIIYSSSYLGILSNYILISNIEVGTFLSNLIPLFAAIKYRSNLKDKASTIITITLLFFYVYGLFKPIMDGRQNIIMSIISSKSYTFYFFAIYLLAVKKIVNYEKIFNFIFYVGVYYSTLYILNKIGIGIRPPEFIKSDGIQCYFDSYLVFSLLYLHSGFCKIKKKVLYTVLLIIGIYLGDFFSLLSTSVVLLPLLYLLIRNWKRKANVLIIVTASLLPLIIAFSLFQNTQTYKNITEKQSDALYSRNAHNEFRWQLIEKEYNWGYGFIHKDSHYLSLYTDAENNYMNSLSFSDSGYIDLMGRFGLYGSIIFLLLPLYMIVLGFKNIKNAFCVILILQFFVVNMTWAVFTYQMGIILLAIAYSYIINNCQTVKE